MTNVPTMYINASFVMRETVCIALMLAVLNLVDMMATDIMNAYITALCKFLI